MVRESFCNQRTYLGSLEVQHDALAAFEVVAHVSLKRPLTEPGRYFGYHDTLASESSQASKSNQRDVGAGSK